MRTTFAVALVLGLLLPGLAWAVEVKSAVTTSDAKRIYISVTLSAAIADDDYKVVSNFAGNFVAIEIKDLKCSKQQLKNDVPPPEEELKQFYKHLRYTQDAEAGQVRIYLTKLVSPADVLVELREKRIEVEILKPLWKLPGVKPADEAVATPETAPADTPPADTSATPEPPLEPVAPETAWPPATGSLRPQDETLPPETTPEYTPEPPADETPEPAPDEATPPTTDSTNGTGAAESPNAVNGDIYNETSISDLPGTHPAPPEGTRPERTPPPAEPEPAPDETPTGFRNATGPAYTQFDLDQVPISGVEIRGLPFNQALMKLVSSSGFNIVVGKGVEDTVVNLNFTQKQITLKGALDLLCIAYDLAYSIEPDAIVIKAKGI